MTIRACYERLQGDYDDIYSRLEDEEAILYFMQIFLTDESYGLMLDAIKENDVSTAYREAHTFKGVCSNLAFEKLKELMLEVLERLYSNKIEQVRLILPDLDEEYRRTVTCIQEFMNQEN